MGTFLRIFNCDPLSPISFKLGEGAPFLLVEENILYLDGDHVTICSETDDSQDDLCSSKSVPSALTATKPRVGKLFL